MSDTDLVSIVESMIGMVRNERVASYNEGVDTERERCVRLVESYMCSTGNLAALAEQIRHPEDVDGGVMTQFADSYRPVAIHLTDSDVLEYVTADTACVYDQIDCDFAIIRQMGSGDIIGFRLERFSKLRR